MRATTDWPRFLSVTLVGAVAVFLLDILWNGVIARGMYGDYPMRPEGEIRALLPFLLLTFCCRFRPSVTSICGSIASAASPMRYGGVYGAVSSC